MRQRVACIGPRSFPEISSPVSERCISLPVPVISLEVLMICTLPIFLPALIAPLIFVSLPVENTLHTANALLRKAQDIRSRVNSQMEVYL